jgi:SAM-dependent methyltransferase
VHGEGPEDAVTGRTTLRDLAFSASSAPPSPPIPTVVPMTGHAHGHAHAHGHTHFGEDEWKAHAAHAELEGEVLLRFVTDAAGWISELRGQDAPVRRVLDVGSGPGVGTCELARCFPDAHVIALDGSTEMLTRTTQRAAALGLADRVGTHLAELPAGLEDVAPVDLIWASMSLHHIGDETGALRVLRDALRPSGMIAVVEVADPLRVLPDELDVGAPGLADRMERAEREWFAEMRRELPGSVPSAPLPSMLAAAGYEVLGAQVAQVRLDPPLPDAARRLAAGRIRLARHQVESVLDEDDRRALAVLGDEDDPRSLLQRPDAFVAASRQIVIARPHGG